MSEKRMSRVLRILNIKGASSHVAIFCHRWIEDGVWALLDVLKETSSSWLSYHGIP
jgi:hypothetical protein